MSTQRAAGLALLLCTAAACAPYTSARPSGIAPELGPKASIHATYFGGLTNRSVHAWFTLREQPAYVVVAHLSGEGRIQVLYPETPNDRAMVPAGQSIRTPSFMAPYDGLPSLYSHTVTPIRNPSARIHSYDGRGHAYIFLVASRKPLRFDAISESGLWNELDVPRYYQTHDPRLLVRDFAELVADGEPYTLEFADSYKTQALSSYADAAWDCMVLSMAPFFVLDFMHPYSFASAMYRSGCGGSRYSSLDMYLYPRRTYYGGYTPPAVPVFPPKADSTEGATMKSDRVGHRRRGQSGRAIEFTNSTLAERGEARRRADGTYPRPIDGFTQRPRQRDDTERARPMRDDSPSRASAREERARPEARPERTERAQPERIERPQPVERSQPQRAEPRAEPQPRPQSQPAERPRPRDP
jgi:hypothetical protein